MNQAEFEKLRNTPIGAAKPAQVAQPVKQTAVPMAKTPSTFKTPMLGTPTPKINISTGNQWKDQNKFGLAGDIGKAMQTVDESLSKSVGAISKPYEALKGATGGILSGLNKVFIEPVDRFVGGAVNEINKTVKDEKMNPIVKSLSMMPPVVAIKALPNVFNPNGVTLGNGADISGGLLPNKQLLSPEMGKKLDNPVTDFLLGKGTFGQVASAVSNPNWAANLAANIATPGIPAEKLLKVAGKAPIVAKAVDKVGDVIKGSERLSSIAETLKPGSVLPELKKIIDESKIAQNMRENESYRKIKTLFKDLSSAESQRVGQLMEGGATIASKGSRAEKVQQVATEMNKMFDDIGQELVDLGRMTPETFAEYKGKYLPHIANEVFKQIEEEGGKIPKELRGGGGFLSGIKTGFLKKRTGELTDYSRNAAPVSMIGLASEIKAAEKTRALDKAIQIYGKKAEPLTPSSTFGNELMNELLKDSSKKTAAESRKMARGLGVVQNNTRTPNELAMELLNTIADYTPAKQIPASNKKIRLRFSPNAPGEVGKVKKIKDPGSIGMGVKGLATNVSGGREIIKKTKTPRAWTMTSGGFTPTESVLKTPIEKVGSLPQKAERVKQLKVAEKLPAKIPVGHVSVRAIEGIPEEIAKRYEDTYIPSLVAKKLGGYYATKKKDLADKVGDFLLNAWKQMKTTSSLTPAYFIGNQNSNAGQIAIETGKNIAQTTKDTLNAMGELAGKIKPGKFLREYEDVSGATPTIQKVKNIMNKVDDKAYGYKDLLGTVIPGMGGNLQNWQEHAAKYTIYSHYREKGMGINEAWDKAQKAIFSPGNISSEEKGLTKLLIPFYNWQRQEIPYFLSTYAKHPERYAAYTKAKSGVESLSQPQEGAPEYMQGQWRLPAKDEQGGQLYLDPSRHVPYGVFTRPSGQNDLPLGFGLNPFFDIPSILRGVDPQYGGPLTKSLDPEEQNAAKVKALSETFGTNALREYRNLGASLRGETEPASGRKRTVGQWVSRQFGTKITSLPQEKIMKSKQIESSALKSQLGARKSQLKRDLLAGKITYKEFVDKMDKESKALTKSLTK